MTRGQGEFLGALAVIILMATATYVASGWILAISTAAREAVRSVERSREALDVHIESEGVSIVNRGPRRAHIDLAYVELEGGEIVVEKVDMAVASGEAVYIGLGHPSVKRVCVETNNGNAFCSSEARVAPYIGIPFLTVERVQPRGLAPISTNDANHVPYRDRRVVAPGTSFYVYAVPRDRATIVYSDEEVLKDLPIYINTEPQGNRYILIKWYGSDPLIDPQALVDHDDGTRSTRQRIGTRWTAICIDLGFTVKGWLYLYLQRHAWANEPWMYVAVSNNTCSSFSQGRVIFTVTEEEAYPGGPYSSGIRGVWLTNARSILINTSVYYDFYSLEFYPYNTTKTVLTFPQLLYREPIVTTVSVLALSGTYVQVVEMEGVALRHFASIRE